MRSLLLLRTATRCANRHARTTAIISDSVFFVSNGKTTATTTTSSDLGNTVRSFATARTDLLAVIKKEHKEEVDAGRAEMSEDLTYLMETVRKNAWRIIDDGGELFLCWLLGSLSAFVDWRM
jgi:hypothetical protein